MFSNLKSIVLFFLGVFGMSYIGKLKYKAYKAEKELKKVEVKIALTKVKIIKEKAKSKEIEQKSEIKVLKGLKRNSSKIRKEMIEIEQKIAESNEVKIKV